MEIEDYIERIIEKGKIEDMRTLSDMLEESMEIIKDYDKECYKKFETELYKMAYGNTLNKEMAERIVNNMKPYGEKWTINETMDMQERYGINDIKSSDFYVVLNSSFNDYHNIFGEDIEMYVKLAEDFIRDEDAKQDKVFLYYTTVVKE